MTRSKIKQQNEGEFVNFQNGGSLGLLVKNVEGKFKDINYILLTVIAILIVMVVTVLIDSFHINSVTYKEYSAKTESVETTLKINKELLDENQKNQKIIIEQQKQIQELLKK